MSKYVITKQPFRTNSSTCHYLRLTSLAEIQWVEDEKLATVFDKDTTNNLIATLRASAVNTISIGSKVVSQKFILKKRIVCSTYYYGGLFEGDKNDDDTLYWINHKNTAIKYEKAQAARIAAALEIITDRAIELEECED